MNYHPGDEISTLNDNPITLKDSGNGLLLITKVNKNRTFTMQHIPQTAEHVDIC